MFEIVVFSFTLGSVLILNFFCKKKNFLLDVKYSDHKKLTSLDKVPLIGGLVILLSSLIFLPSSHLFFKITLITIFLIGFLSDINYLKSPIKRLILQFFSIAFFIVITDTHVSSIRIPYIDYLFENFYFKYLFTIICLTILINGTNFIDGLNTLSIGYYLLVILTVFYINFEYNLGFEINGFKIIGLILMVLFFFNVFGKLYLGDAGAYLVSFYTGIQLINISNFNQTISPYFIALLLWYPAYENLFSIIRKKLSNSSVINADNKHLHQLIFLFLKKKRIPQFFSNFFAALIINMFNLIVFYLATENMYQTKNLIIIIICNLMIYNLVYLHLKKSIR